VWSFLYGAQHGNVEIILDNAPARSAELLTQDRVDAALVPVIMSQFIPDVRVIPNVCVGAKERVQSVALITRGAELSDVRSVALDVSSRTSVILTKIIFREFLGFEPEWREAAPDIDAMLHSADCALLIGDPALAIWDLGSGISDFESVTTDADRFARHAANSKSQIPDPKSQMRKYDLAHLWNHHTGLGFVFAMWMTRRDESPIDFAAARDEGVQHISEIASNYEPEIGLSRDQMIEYLSDSISYSVDDSMQAGMKLYFELAGKCRLIDSARPIRYLE
jgi:chorismate dehydratase